NLLFQFFHRTEFHFRPLETAEPGSHFLPVCIAFISVDIHFKKSSALIRDRRLNSRISHAVVPFSVDHHTAGIDPVSGKDLPRFGLNIHSGKSQCTPKPLPVPDRT